MKVLKSLKKMAVAFFMAGILCGSVSMTASAEKTQMEIPADTIASGVIDEDYGQIIWFIDNNGHLSVSGTGDIRDPNKEHSFDTGIPWEEYQGQISSAQINVTGMKNASYLFWGCRQIRSIDVSGFDTSNVTNMSCMFGGCENLETLDLNGFDTSNVTDMSNMFEDCENLKTLDLSKFDTSKVTDMSGMFSSCYKITVLDLSSFDTSKVINMSAMFYCCNSIMNLDVSGFDTSKVTSTAYMFECCSSIENLDLTNFDTSKVTDMRRMFMGCSKITTLDLSNFDTGEVTDMREMFFCCSRIVNIDLSSFDTNKVTDMCRMFADCSEITTLDLSSFDANKVTNMGDMLSYCKNFSVFHSPRYIQRTLNLPQSEAFDRWYTSDGTELTSIPQNLSYSITVGKNHIPKNKENPEITQENVLYFSKWEEETQIAYFGDTEYVNFGFIVNESTNLSFKKNLNDLLNNFVYVESQKRDDGLIGPDYLLNITTVETRIGTYNEGNSDLVKIDNKEYPLGKEISLYEYEEGDIIRYHLIDDSIVALKKLAENTGYLNYFNKDSREVKITEDSETITYKLHSLVSGNEIKALGETGEKDEAVRFVSEKIADNIKYIYDIQKIPDNRDSDGDGLINEWEKNGADVDGDGEIDIHIELMGADPYTPDIFIEIDWMYQPEESCKLILGDVTTQDEIDLCPDSKLLRIVYQQFKDHGYNLHLDAGPDSIDFVTGNAWEDLSAGNAISYDEEIDLTKSMQNWTDLINDNFSFERGAVFRHCMFINRFARIENGIINNSSSGLSYTPGQFFLVADCDGLLSEKGVKGKAGTFMHELGHSLGLTHGGITVDGKMDDTNYKPNYLSIMNYSFQFRGLFGVNGLESINYSEYTLPSIDENNIDESKGVDPSGETAGTHLGTIWYDGNSERYVYNIANSAIDFNGKKGATETALSMNLNKNGDSDGKTQKNILYSTKSDWDCLKLKAGIIGEIQESSLGENYKIQEDILDSYVSHSVEKALEDGLFGYSGECGFKNLTPLTMYTDVNNQELKFQIFNLHNTETNPTIKVFSTLNNINFEKTILLTESHIKGSGYELNIPVGMIKNVGIFNITLQLYDENGNIKEETFQVTIKKPEVLEIAKGNSTDIYKDGEVNGDYLSWNIEHEEIVSITDNQLRADNLGETIVSAMTSNNEIIAFYVKVHENTNPEITPVITSVPTPEKPVVQKKSVTEIFTDIYNDWYTQYVQYAYDNNLMTGIKGTKQFAPNANVTKAQVAQVLYNMENQPEIAEKTVFTALTDVYKSDWYANAVAWAYNTGVVTGDTNAKKFFPNADVTREQLALMMYRYAQYKSYDTSASSDLAGLRNAENTANWALEGVRWAVGSGLISGIEKDGMKDIAPQGNATRAQMAAILQRFCEFYK